jgi:hypothetical protein
MALSAEHALNLLLAAATVAADTGTCSQLVLKSIEEIEQLAMLSAEVLGVDVSIERQDGAACIFFAPRHQDQITELPQGGLGKLLPMPETPTGLTPRRS